MTGLDVITQAMQLIGVLAAGEAPGASEANDSLLWFNNLLDSWSNEGLIAFPVLRETFAMSSVGINQTYTWGIGGQLNSARPMSIRSGLIQLTGSAPPIELPLQMVNVDQYAAFVLKTITSNFPLYCYIDDAYPYRNVSVCPVPTDPSNSLVFYSVKPLAQSALNTSLSLPPGYLRALTNNLAVELAPMFGRAIPAIVAKNAMDAKAAIKRNNTKPFYLGMDTALRGMPSVYNWKTDGYER